METDTIAAIATPAGAGGIGIIRISGPAARRLGEKLFEPERREGEKATCHVDQRQGAAFTPRKLALGKVIDPEIGAVLDEVLMTFMPAPHSYTCEDVIEIQAHAGIVGLNAILALVLKQGARLAEPGEFTKRAFLNGRIDLTQAEAVIDIISAKTERALRLASGLMGGSLRDVIERATNGITYLLAEVEAGIDFPDECEALYSENAKQKFKEDVVEPLTRLLRNYDHGRVLREGLRIVILGRPNVGKSSLMNRLLKRDRAIVTEIPGTTRDTIEETINISGVPVVMVDTAGMRESMDPVESAGIRRAERLAKEADLILFMLDAAEGITAADVAVYSKIELKPIIVVLNKVDLETEGQPAEIPENWCPKDGVVRTSVRFETGIDRLKERIYEFAVGQEGVEESQAVPNQRQKSLIESGVQATLSVEAGLVSGISPELLAIDLRDAMNALNQIVGKDAHYDILDDIFSRFCIGK